MALRTDTFDLGALRLTAGEGRRLELHVGIAPVHMSGESYPVIPELVPALLEVSRTTGDGYALRLRFEAGVDGPCMRCLGPAARRFAVDSREVSQPNHRAPDGATDDELNSPYVQRGVVDLEAWARDALVLSLPAALLCRDDCAGLCPVCGADLNTAGPEHAHEQPPDSRWSKLSELRFDA